MLKWKFKDDIKLAWFLNIEILDWDEVLMSKSIVIKEVKEEIKEKFGEESSLKMEFLLWALAFKNS